MQKISSPQELQFELRRLIAYCQEAQPSRTFVASALRDLADRVGAKAPPLTVEDLTSPLTTDAIVMFDPYPMLDNGNLKLKKGEVVIEVLEKYFSRDLGETVKLTPTSKRKGNALIVDAKHGSETTPVEVSLQRLKTK